MNKKSRKKRRWKKFALEFLSIFIAVISAFALNNWNENRRNNFAEKKILTEIAHGLDKDIMDVQANMGGHQDGLKANEFWRKILTNEVTNLDSLQTYYFDFLRDYVSIQNTSGYENLKSRGLELIRNDSLRSSIISLYEFDYKALKSLEEEYYEMQFFENYFKEINNLIAPNFQYSSTGSLTGIKLPLDITEKEKMLTLSYLYKIKENRKFVLRFYKSIENKISNLKKNIEKEID